MNRPDTVAFVSVRKEDLAFFYNYLMSIRPPSQGISKAMDGLIEKLEEVGFFEDMGRVKTINVPDEVHLALSRSDLKASKFIFELTLRPGGDYTAPKSVERNHLRPLAAAFGQMGLVDKAIRPDNPNADDEESLTDAEVEEKAKAEEKKKADAPAKSSS